METSINNNKILVGVINSAHGIKGEVVLTSYTEPVSNILSMDLFDHKGQQISISKKGINKNNKIICSIEGCKNRNQAEELKGLELFCLREDFQLIEDEDEFYIQDLIGKKVLDQQHQEIGIIKQLANYGAGDIIEIKFNDSNKTLMFPFNKLYFPTITDQYVILTNPNPY